MQILRRYFMMLSIVLMGNMLGAEEETDKPQPFATNVLLVLLDKSESDIGAITISVLTALEQQAAPVVVSLVTLHNIFTLPSLDEIVGKQPEAERSKYENIKKYYDAVDAVIREKLSNGENYSLPGPQIGLEMALNNPGADEDFKVSKALQDLAEMKKNASYNSLKDADAAKVRRALIKRVVVFKQDEWLVKRIDADLVLLVPQSYIQKIKARGVKAQARGFSELEALLGLQVDHMEAIANLIESAQQYKNMGGYVNFATALNKIFVPRTAYAQEKPAEEGAKKNVTLGTYFVPTWAIFMNGHGGPNVSVAGLPLAQFRQVLDFFATYITVRLLAYLSCYAAGVNTKLLYVDAKTRIVKDYPFAIVTGALTDAPTATLSFLVPFDAFASEDIDFKRGTLKLRHYLDFLGFVQQMSTLDTIDYSKAISPVLKNAQGLMGYFELSNEQRSKGTRSSDITDTPQLKLPGIPWFNVIDSNRRLVSIGKTLALHRTQDLNVIKFFKIDKPLGILLYTNRVPFKLNLAGVPPAVKFIDMLSTISSLQLYIEGLSVDFNLYDLSKTFDVMLELDVERTISINELTVNAGDPSHKQVYRDVVIRFHTVNGKRVMSIYRTVALANENRVEKWDDKFSVTPKWDPLSDKETEEFVAVLNRVIPGAITPRDRLVQKGTAQAIQKAQEKKIGAKSPEAFEAQMKQELEDKRQTAQQLALLEQSLLGLSMKIS
jgi:hypothetical protein